MIDIKKNIGIINSCVQSRMTDRDYTRPKFKKVDKFAVKATDERGKEYEIRYFF